MSRAADLPWREPRFPPKAFALATHFLRQWQQRFAACVQSSLEPSSISTRWRSGKPDFHLSKLSVSAEGFRAAGLARAESPAPVQDLAEDRAVAAVPDRARLPDLIRRDQHGRLQLPSLSD